MSPREISDVVLQEPPVVRADDELEQAIRVLLDSDLPAVPVVDEDDRYAGIFGEREFMGAVFPGYLGDLRNAGFVSASIEAALERRDACRSEPVAKYMNSEHVEVGPDYADVEVAEIFLHHRVLVVPVVDAGRVLGLITRHGFFTALAARFVNGGAQGAAG